MYSYSFNPVWVTLFEAVMVVSFVASSHIRCFYVLLSTKIRTCLWQASGIHPPPLLLSYFLTLITLNLADFIGSQMLTFNPQKVNNGSYINARVLGRLKELPLWLECVGRHSCIKSPHSCHYSFFFPPFSGHESEGHVFWDFASFWNLFRRNHRRRSYWERKCLQMFPDFLRSRCRSHDHMDPLWFTALTELSNVILLVY